MCLFNCKIILVDGERLGRFGVLLKVRFVMTAVFVVFVFGVVNYDLSMMMVIFVILVRNVVLFGYL